MKIYLMFHDIPAIDSAQFCFNFVATLEQKPYTLFVTIVTYFSTKTYIIENFSLH